VYSFTKIFKDKVGVDVAKVRDEITGAWVSQHSDIWPESLHMPDDENNEGDDDGKDDDDDEGDDDNDGNGGNDMLVNDPHSPVQSDSNAPDDNGGAYPNDDEVNNILNRSGDDMDEKHVERKLPILDDDYSEYIERVLNSSIEDMTIVESRNVGDDVIVRGDVVISPILRDENSQVFDFGGNDDDFASNPKNLNRELTWDDDEETSPMEDDMSDIQSHRDAKAHKKKSSTKKATKVSKPKKKKSVKKKAAKASKKPVGTRRVRKRPKVGVSQFIREPELGEVRDADGSMSSNVTPERPEPDRAWTYGSQLSDRGNDATAPSDVLRSGRVSRTPTKYGTFLNL
jgi:hypothetical protein